MLRLEGATGLAMALLPEVGIVGNSCMGVRFGGGKILVVVGSDRVA
jgi:hypothetical protein